jgi:hypothetical protein
LGNVSLVRSSLLASAIGVWLTGTYPKVQMPAVAAVSHMLKLENINQKKRAAADEVFSDMLG